MIVYVLHLFYNMLTSLTIQFTHIEGIIYSHLFLFVFFSTYTLSCLLYTLTLIESKCNSYYNYYVYQHILLSLLLHDTSFESNSGWVNMIKLFISMYFSTCILLFTAQWHSCMGPCSRNNNFLPMPLPTSIDPLKCCNY